MVKEITLLKGNVSINKCFIDVSFIFVSVFKGKITNCASIGDGVILC